MLTRPNFQNGFAASNEICQESVIHYYFICIPGSSMWNAMHFPHFQDLISSSGIQYAVVLLPFYCRYGRIRKKRIPVSVISLHNTDGYFVRSTGVSFRDRYCGCSFLSSRQPLLFAGFCARGSAVVRGPRLCYHISRSGAGCLLLEVSIRNSII